MKKYLCLGLAAAMAASVTACGSSSSSTTETTAAAAAAETTAAGSEAAAPAADGETFKIGMIGPLTGGAAAYGLGVRNAAELAINEINAAGGINGYQVEYNPQDDEHDPEKSVNAYNTLKDWGVQFVVGSVTSKPCIAVAAETYADNMFQITPSGSAVECIAEDNAFRVCFSDPDQGKASAQYIAENNLATKIGIIYDSSTEYSTGILESFLAEAKEQGLEVVAEEAFTADNATDFSVQINSLKEAGAELMFMPFYYTEASTVLKQCADIDYAPIFFGVDGMDGILSVENFDTSLAEGVMLLTPFSADEDSSADFVKAYQDAYGEVPNQFAADSYDAVYAIKAAVEHANITPDMDYSDICDAMKVAMTEITIDGLTGTNMTWNATGEPEKAPKAAMIVDGAYVMQ
jgi:branched-chain amino acid transport system substrate-binding protein